MNTSEQLSEDMVLPLKFASPSGLTSVKDVGGTAQGAEYRTSQAVLHGTDRPCAVTVYVLLLGPVI